MMVIWLGSFRTTTARVTKQLLLFTTGNTLDFTECSLRLCWIENITFSFSFILVTGSAEANAVKDKFL